MLQTKSVPQFVQAQLNEAFQEDVPGRYRSSGVTPWSKDGDDGGFTIQLSLTKDEGKDGNIKITGCHSQNSKRLVFFLVY